MSNKWKLRIGWLILISGIALIRTATLRDSLGAGLICLGAMYIESSKYKKDKTT